MVARYSLMVATQISAADPVAVPLVPPDVPEGSPLLPLVPDGSPLLPLVPVPLVPLLRVPLSELGSSLHDAASANPSIRTSPLIISKEYLTQYPCGIQARPSGTSIAICVRRSARL